MALNKYLITSSLLLAISGCTSLEPETKIVTRVEYVHCDIELQPRPQPVKLDDVYWYVVTAENMEQFQQRFAERHDEQVYYAISVPDYEDLSVNMSEILRYIEQQKQLILYYEQIIESNRATPKKQ